MNLSDVLGGFGPGKIIRAVGREWSFVFDVPAMAANIESLCEEARRAAYEKELRLLPERNIPGSFDNQQASRLFDELRQELRSGACAIGHAGNPGGGSFYREWMRTSVGKMSSALAALRVKHPDATLQTLADITNDAPDQVAAVFDELGKALRDAVPKLAASLKDSAPEAAEYMLKGLEKLEAEASLHGSPASGSTLESRSTNCA